MSFDMITDTEWAIFAPILIENRARGGRPPRDHRRTLNGIYWVARTGAPWRDLPREFGAWNSVYRQYRRWTISRVWERLQRALAEFKMPPAPRPVIPSAALATHAWPLEPYRRTIDGLRTVRGMTALRMPGHPAMAQARAAMH